MLSQTPFLAIFADVENLAMHHGIPFGCSDIAPVQYGGVNIRFMKHFAVVSLCKIILGYVYISLARLASTESL